MAVRFGVAVTGFLSKLLPPAVQSRMSVARYQLGCQQVLTIKKQCYCSSSATTNTVVDPRAKALDTLFDKEDMEDIVRTINTSSESELLAFEKFTKKRVARLLKYREEHGEVKALSDMLPIPGFGYVSMKALASCIINKPVPQRTRDGRVPPKYVLHRTHVTPKFVSHQLPSSVLAYDLQTDWLAWVLMTDDLFVQDWNFLPIREEIRVRYDHALYMLEMQRLVEQLPEAELYLYDEQVVRNTTTLTRQQLQRARLESIFSTLLNVRGQETEGAEDKISVYSLRPNVTGTYFDLLVGKERTSCGDAVRDVISGGHDKGRGVYVSFDLAKGVYGKQEDYLQEQMGSCLLQAITFYKLLISRAARMTSVQGAPEQSDEELSDAERSVSGTNKGTSSEDHSGADLTRGIAKRLLDPSH